MLHHGARLVVHRSHSDIHIQLVAGHDTKYYQSNIASYFIYSGQAETTNVTLEEAIVLLAPAAWKMDILNDFYNFIFFLVKMVGRLGSFGGEK